MSDDLDFTGSIRIPVARLSQAPVYDPAVAQAFFRSAGKEESIGAGSVLFSENEKASRMLLKRDKMYYLLEGEITLTTKGEVVGEPKVGEMFGEMAAISASAPSATAIAKTECRVLSLDDRQFVDALQKKPEFALMMLGSMIVRLRSMIAQLADAPSGPADMKESRVFDRTLTATLADGLGDSAVVRYERDKVIMAAGHAGALMYVVYEGRVAISIRGAVVQRLGPGGVFGEMALVDQSPRAASATAETDCTLLAINRTVFMNLVKSEPTFGISLLSAMAERLRNTAAALT
jgi:CRP/FNR family transcriptional regulator, cyclic AMP receptor protein